MWRRDFRLLWLGQAVSELGSAITYLALPLVAAVTLQASTFQVGVLAALGVLGWVVVSLPAGVLVDRVPAKRLLMVCCDLGRLIVVLAIPALAAANRLTIAHLWMAAALVSVLTVVFEIGYWSLVPEVTPKDQLVGAHSKIAITHGLGQVAGPALAGVLVSALGSAVRVLVLDALSFLVSMITLLAMRTSRAGQALPRRAVLSEMGEGITFVRANPLLRRIVTFGSVNALFDSMTLALVVLYLLRELDAAPAVVGLVAAAGAAGGIVGAALAATLSRSLGSARLLWLAPLACGASALLVPLAPPDRGAWAGGGRGVRARAGNGDLQRAADQLPPGDLPNAFAGADECDRAVDPPKWTAARRHSGRPAGKRDRPAPDTPGGSAGLLAFRARAGALRAARDEGSPSRGS